MDNRKLSPADYQIFLFKSLFWLGIVWIGFAAALGGFFYASVIWSLAAVFGIWLTYHISKHHMSIRLSFEMWTVSIAFLFVVILFSLFSTPTVFSGRDQGSISEAAARLAQNHTLEFSTPASEEFFKIYGPGRALNFPGFYYTDQGRLTTQFPLIYTVWLALFYALFGTAGFIIANALLMYVFLFSFYLLIRLFLGVPAALPAIIFAATSFVFMWFSKFTLSENMALPLLWLGILALMLFLRSLRKLHYVVFFLSMILLFFTRIEGVALLAVSIMVISLSKKARAYVKEKPAERLFLPAVIFLAAFAANMFRDINFYREIAKALLPKITLPQAHSLETIRDAVLPNFYIGKIFYLYGLLGFFIVAAVGILIYLWKKESYKLIPFFIVLPTFIYLFDSHITPDHPWMLRRFMFSLAPAAIFYSGLFLGQWLEKKPEERNGKMSKKIAFLITAVLIAANLPAFFNYLTFSENKNLLDQTQVLGNNFSADDLVLIDQQASGDGWSMISGPLGFLYGKNAVYFFNTNDLARLDLQKFNKIYLIAPNKQVPYYLNSTIGNRLVPSGSYSFTFSKLDLRQSSPLETVSFPKKETVTVNGKIFEISK